MRLATSRNGSTDGRLVVMSLDGRYCATTPVATFQQALEERPTAERAPRAISRFPAEWDLAECKTPLLRPLQWLDVSASNANLPAIGSSFMTDRRGIEVINLGQFMRLSDTARMQAVDGPGRAPFGILKQKVVKA